jgi:glycosyltransferase involved in cell wall biosynthesis
MIKGGADENTYSTIIGLNGGRYDIDLMVGDCSELENFPMLENKKVFVVKNLVRDVSPLKDLKALGEIYSFLKKNRYDIVHTHTAKGGFIGRISARLAKVPIIIHTLHGTTFGDFLPFYRRKLYIALEKMAISKTDKIISVSRDLINKYIGQKIGYPEKYTVIYSGIDTDRFYEAGKIPETEKIRLKKELGLDPYDITIVNISRLEPRKGHKYFLESASRIIERFPQVKFLIVGDGDYKEVLKKRADEFKLSSNLIFTGSRQDIEKVIAISDVSVLTSLWEGLPRVLIQSAAVGKPIVTFEVEGVREIVQNGINGFIVPSRDIETLTERIIFLLEDLEQARNMGIQGREIVGDAWNVENMVNRIDEVYKEQIRMKLNVD